ncbi:MAG: hypothetical protein J6B48_04405 [Clostridia bacterium]|nr:hypothetical protein [Clostridia bacterium]
MNLQNRKVIAILGAEDFSEEKIPELEEILVTRLDRGEVLFVSAGIDGDNEVFKLLCNLSQHYPSVSFFAVLSNDIFLKDLIRSGKGDLIEKGIISFDIALTAQTPKEAEKLRDTNIINRADTVIYPQDSRFDATSFIKRHSFNQKTEIIAL